MKVVLSGYFGFGNIGDEAILEAMIKGLRALDPKTEIIVLSANSVKTSQTFNVSAVPRMDLSKISRAIRRSNILISGGGGLLQDVTGPLSILYYLGIIYLAKAWWGRGVAVLGQGIGPVRGFLSKLLVRWILNKVDLIVVRDEQSYIELRSLKVKRPPIFIAGDASTILEPVKSEEIMKILSSEGITKGEGSLVGFSIRKPSHKLSRDKAKVYYKVIADLADSIIEKFGAKVIFIPFLYPQDIIESSKIINQMRNPVNVIIREYSTRQIMGIVSQMDVLVGMRLHSHMFAAMAGVPMLGIAYDPKVAIFLEGLGQSSLNVEDVGEGNLFELFEKTWQRKKEISEAALKSSQELRTKGETNFKIFFEHFKYYKKSTILGVEFDNVTLDEALQEIEHFVQSGKPHLVATPNPEMVVYSLKDPQFRSIINKAALKLADGVGIILASRILGGNIKEKVSGVDLIPSLAKIAEQKGYSIYILGSRPGVAREAAEVLQREYKSLKIAGTYHGYFLNEEEHKVIDSINSAKPEILLVGMGFPKQENFLARNLSKLRVGAAITVGGSIDVIAGRIRRAPKWMRAAGLEWFYRLISQPSRFLRMLVLPYFLFKVTIEGVRKGVR